MAKNDKGKVRKTGKKNPVAEPKTLAVCKLFWYLLQPRTIPEMSDYLHVSGRAVHRYLLTLEKAGIPVYREIKGEKDKIKHSLINPEGRRISSVHFNPEGDVMMVVYFDRDGQQVMRWSQEFTLLNLSFSRYLPKR